MSVSRLPICAAVLGLLSATPAIAAPGYVTTNVKLRSAAGTTKPVMAKIPAGSLVDAANCTDWCRRWRY